MKIWIAPCVALMVVFGFAPDDAAAQQLGQLKVHFEYGGNPADPLPINVTKDKAFCGKTELVDERLIVNKENKGIKNVILYVYTRGDSGFKVEPGKATHELANAKCRFEPHIVIAQTGDKLKVTNPDEVSHNANLQFISNNAQNFTVPPGQEKIVELTEKEPAPIPVACNIHPWMTAYVVVLDHPYVGLSDENGDLTINNLPVGEELVFRVYHESGSFKGATIGSTEFSRRNTIELEIKPGLNDLGKVVMPAIQLAPAAN